MKGGKLEIMLKYFKTVFTKLIVSHLFIIALLAISIGVFASNSFTSMLEDEIVSNDRELTARVSEGLAEQAFLKIDKQWVEMSRSNDLVNRFFTYPQSLNTVDLYNLFKYIESLKKQNSNLIDCIEIYSSDVNVLISSTQGIKYIREYDDEKPYKAFKSIVEKGTNKSQWILPEDSENGNNTKPTLFRTYPFIKDAELPFKCYLAITLNDNAINSIIDLQNENAENKIYILNSEGLVLSATDRSMVGRNISGEQYVKDIRLSNNDEYSLKKIKIDKKMCVVSSRSINSLDLKVIRIVPFRDFYKKTTIINWMIFLICFVFSTIGILVSVYFVKSIYQPLSNITSNIKKLTNNSTFDKNVDEYGIISNAITNLSTKVNNLKTTLEDNMSLIKNNVINTILTEQNIDMKSFSDRLTIAQIKFLNTGFLAVLINLNTNESEKESIRNLEFYKYDLIKYMENLSNKNVSFKATAIGSTNIGVIINSSSMNNDIYNNYISNIIDYAKKEHDILPYIGVGSWQNTLDKLNMSYMESEKSLKYMYIYPDEQIFIAEKYLIREISEIEFSKNNLSDFYQSLKGSDFDNIKNSIHKLVQEIKNSECSLNLCEYRINEILNTILKVIMDQNINIKDIFNENIYIAVQKIKNINIFEIWIVKQIEKLLYIKSNKTVIDNSVLIEKAVNFIEQNLSEDISLSLVAEKIFITPPYLSKMFKKEVGMNFNSYVTEKRLEEAKNLLLNTNYSINKISEKVGFNSANYLIKKFRERYGDSPVNYKKATIEKIMKKTEK